MLDRQRVEAILRRRFAGTTDQQVAAAANALMELDKQRDDGSDRCQAPGCWCHFTGVRAKKDGRWQVVASHGSRFNEGH